MTVESERDKDQLLLLLYQLRDALQAIQVDVHVAYPSGSKERNAYALATLGAQHAIMDLENERLQSVTDRMAEALPDIAKATKDLKKDLRDLEDLVDKAQMAGKALAIVEKIIKAVF